MLNSAWLPIPIKHTDRQADRQTDSYYTHCTITTAGVGGGLLCPITMTQKISAHV